MESLMTYMAAFGLAAGAGAKAVIPVLALGAFSYTPYFELSQRFAWIADPAVMIVLGVLVFVEIVVDAHPDLGRFSDVAAYLPKVVAGFLGFAAVTGTLDDSMVHRRRCPLAAQPDPTSVPRPRRGRPRDRREVRLGR